MSEPTPEPTIAINGVLLTEGQTFTLRVALLLLHSNLALAEKGRLEDGQTLAADTRTRAREILRLLGEDVL